MKTLRTLCILAIALLSINLCAQEDEKEYKMVDASLQLKNAHIWRSLDVTSHAMIDADVRIKDKSNMFAFGIWGATTFDNDFREFDYYVSFNKAGFTFELWDIYNFSDKNQFDPITKTGYNTKHAFKYSAKETGHFIDARLGYTFPEKFPLHIGWSTVVFGRDRGPLNDANRYSTYVEADYPILKHEIVDLNVGLAGAFALRKSKDANGKKIDGHFYGKSAGIVNVNLTATKTVAIGKSYKLPISVMAVWAPESHNTHLQIALDVLRF